MHAPLYTDTGCLVPSGHRSLRVLRVFRVLRVVKLFRYLESLKMIAAVGDD